MRCNLYFAFPFLTLLLSVLLAPISTTHAQIVYHQPIVSQPIYSPSTTYYSAPVTTSYSPQTSYYSTPAVYQSPVYSTQTAIVSSATPTYYQATSNPLVSTGWNSQRYIYGRLPNEAAAPTYHPGFNFNANSTYNDYYSDTTRYYTDNASAYQNANGLYYRNGLRAGIRGSNAIINARERDEIARAEAFTRAKGLTWDNGLIRGLIGASIRGGARN